MTLRKKILFLTVAFLLVSLSVYLSTCHAETLETRHCIVNGDAKALNAELKYYPEGYWGRASWVPVDIKLDAMAERVKTILGMPIQFKIKINVYDSAESLKTAPETPLLLRAWYDRKTDTIYVNKNDVDEGVLAHEMAHAVIEHYLEQFGMMLPKKAHEILARYVDTHLFY